jgi:hypothetical protein
VKDQGWLGPAISQIAGWVRFAIAAHPNYTPINYHSKWKPLDKQAAAQDPRLTQNTKLLSACTFITGLVPKEKIASSLMENKSCDVPMSIFLSRCNVRCWRCLITTTRHRCVAKSRGQGFAATTWTAPTHTISRNYGIRTPIYQKVWQIALATSFAIRRHFNE